MMAALFVASAALACRPVAGERILGSDLAAAAPALAGLPADTLIGYAPRPGAQRVFYPANLVRLAAAAGLRVDGSLEPVCFERATAPLDRERVAAAMRRSLDLPDAHVAIVELSAYPAPAGEIVFPRERLSEPPSGDTAAWNGYVEYPGGRFSIWARVRIGVRERRVVAAADLEPGLAVKADQVRVEEPEVFPHRVRPLSAPEQAVGRISRRRIAAGTPLTASALEAPHEIERGDMVAVEVFSGLAVLKLEARAEAAGRRGDEVALRNTSSGKQFRARVAGQGRAVLECGREGHR